MSRPSVLRNWL